MATDPAFAATPHAGSAVTNATADTSLTAPTNFATVFTAGTNGSKIEQIRAVQILTTAAAGILNYFLYDGTTYHLFDQYPYPISTVSTTAAVVPIDIAYNNLVMATGWSLRVTNTVLSNTGATSSATHNIIALGGDF